MKTAHLLILLFAVTCASAAQQVSGDKKPDSLSSDRILNPGISPGRLMLLLPLPLQGEPDSVIPPFLSAGRTPGAPPPFLAAPSEQKADLTGPLRLQMKSEEQLKPLWMVLGTVEAGGAAYAAYRYIRKHGLK